MTRDGIAVALNALSDASCDPVGEADLLPILVTGDEPGHLVRTLFEDCCFDTFDRLGATLGVSRAEIRAAYARAKLLHAVANGDLDDGDDT